MTPSLEEDELERRVAERTAELRAANAATEQALRESEARFRAERLDAIGRLAGGVAHDFNNILLVIRGYSSIMRSTLDAHHIADVEEIAKAADRATELTRQLLAFARRQVLQPRVISVFDTVRGLEPLLRHSIRENVELNLELADGLPTVLADPAQIEQVIVNLVANAGDAAADGGSVRISVGCAELTGAEAGISPALAPGRYVVLAVADTGSGISEEVLPYVFEPFFTTKKGGVGTGFGLSTVYGVVVQSGGGIDVRSHAGRGSTFTVYLPVAAAAGAGDDEDEPSVGEADASLPRRAETILLVEDEAAVRELVRRVLEAARYRVLAAELPSEAERLLDEEQDVDLLLTDVVMPEMSGYELAARALERRPEIRTLFMSGYSHPAAGSQPVHGDLLRKPFTTDELTQTVRKTLDS